MSFCFDNVTPKDILLKTFAKAGHPFPMILLLKMDCAIIEEEIRQPWMHIAELENPKYREALDSYTEETVNVEDINFSEYEIVYTEDPILSKDIILAHPNTVFAYNTVEDHACNYGDHYDIFFDHAGHRHADRTGFSFPQCPSAVSQFKSESRNNIYIEYRTIKLNVSDVIKNRTGLDIVQNEGMAGAFYGITWPPSTGLEYWENLGRCKYYIQLPAEQGIRLGQAFGDAASMGLVNIGMSYDQTFVHPFCRTDSVDKAIEIVNNIENDRELLKQVLSFQDQNIQQKSDAFLETLEEKLLIKRQK